ncbi:site-specific integrase [Aureimonas psammosilenae]|uniref:site-specific integrase n=1 Tax=Aureimonas psammosilenae TaxID=2495496 RepID=UPI0012609725|nr:site-specific integrase [Aureimonas psammosilenae]
MARLTYLERRGAVYYARIDVPVDLVAHYGTTTKKKSLRTKEEAVAKVRLWPVVEAWRLEFEDVLSRRAITDDDKADAVWRHYIGALERDEERRKRLPGQAEIDAASLEMFARVRETKLDIKDPLAILDATLEVKALEQARELDARARKAKLDDLCKHLVKGETALIAHEVDAYAEANKLIVERGSDEWNDLARKMMRADIETLERTMERDRGDYSGSPKDPIVRPAAGGHREQAKAGETIMELFEIYASENPKGISADTLNQARRDVGTFVETVGRTCPVHRIDKRAVRDWKALLVRYPVKATETKAFAGMTMAQAVRENEKIGKPVLTPRTVNRYLAGLGAFSAWLVNHGYLNANPVEGMSLAKKKERSTSPFTTDQLNTLFDSPLFTGAQSATEWRLIARAGKVLIRDHRYWVPLVMLYSGARPAEIAQLAVSDVREEHGVWIMHITTEGEGDKQVKTAGSMRVVPIHSELIRLGFLKHHKEMKATGQARLFPEAKRNNRGQMIAEFSREFGRYLERIGLKEGRGVSLYSFRHGAVDALRRAGYLDEQFGFLLGHTKGTMTGRYGHLPQGMLRQRVELVEAIGYTGFHIDCRSSKGDALAGG